MAQPGHHARARWGCSHLPVWWEREVGEGLPPSSWGGIHLDIINTIQRQHRPLPRHGCVPWAQSGTTPSISTFCSVLLEFILSLWIMLPCLPGQGGCCVWSAMGDPGVHRLFCCIATTRHTSPA